MTEPTQTPSVPMPLADIKPTSADEAIHRLHDSERRRMKDRDEAAQRIAELDARVKRLEELASLWSEYADFLYKANEGPITIAHAHGWRCSVDDVEKGREYRAKIAALSPSPPAVEKVEHQTVDYPLRLIEHTDGRMEWRDDAPVEVERWAKEKAAHKVGKRIQKRWLSSALPPEESDWFDCAKPEWHDNGKLEYRIHPDEIS